MKIRNLFVLILLSISVSLNAQMPFGGNPFAHTFSIVARDSRTGEIGVGVQSHWFSVGTLVTWGEAGVGVIATQSFVNPAFGLQGLELLKKGLSPKEVVDKLIGEDEGRDFRQLAVLDAKGRVAAYTGSKCIQPAGHITGDQYSVQANMMMNDKVWPTMSEAFKKSSDLPLAERILAALNAAQQAGGDVRGKQSAAILVFKGESTGKPWADKLVDLRVDDSPEPLKELGRILKVHRAYEHMNNGDLAVEKNDMNKAMEEYSAAMKMFPDNLEMKYWTAIALANKGNIKEALPMFKEVFDKDKNWRDMTPRLLPNGMLNVKPEDLKMIMEQ